MLSASLNEELSVKILIIDDDADLLEMTARRLKRKGFETSSASTLSDATSLFDAEQNSFAAVICDLFLADGENGLNFFEALKAKNFRGYFILATGDDSGDVRISQYAATESRFTCLQKPFPLEELVLLLSNKASA
jgi:DNA-binding NtrC family response regulator